MTGLTLPTADLDKLRAALRAGAGRWIARFYRHELLVARTVRGMQEEAIREFNREIVNPLLRQVAGRLATFDLRGPDVVLELFPQLRALQAEIEATVARGSDAVRRLTTERLYDLTRQESDWVRESATKVLKVDPAPVNDAAIREKVRTRPFLGAPVEKWFAKMLTVPTGDNARAWIQTGLQQGLTTDQIVRGLRGTKATGYTDGILTGQGERAVATLVRTAATHASTVARQESFKAIGVDKYRFVATLDSKTSIQCAANDGKVFDIDGPEALPPLHPHCLPGDALVSTVGRVAGVAKRWFDGEVCIIRTASGRVLTGTPNHPVLTDRGWVAIGALAEGDNVVCDGGSQWRGPVDGDRQHVPSTIHEVAESFLASSDVASVPVPVSAPHFHGDADDGQVAVVGADRRLRPDLHAAIGQHRSQLGLVGAGDARESGATLGDEGPVLGRVPLAADGRVSGGRQPQPLLGAGSTHPGHLLLGPVAAVATAGCEGSGDRERGLESKPLGDRLGADAVVMERDGEGQTLAIQVDPLPGAANASPLDGPVGMGATDAELARHVLDGRAGPVFLDELVKVERAHFVGHVYNLETTVGFYSANGIVTHNCRSTTVPYFGEPIGNRASIDGPVPADQTFRQWLEGRPIGEQDEVLGKTRAGAWRAGKLSFDQMVGRDLQPLTVAELRRLDRIPDDE